MNVGSWLEDGFVLVVGVDSTLRSFKFLSNELQVPQVVRNYRLLNTLSFGVNFRIAA